MVTKRTACMRARSAEGMPELLSFPPMTLTRPIQITNEITFGGDHPPLFIAGPCVIESREHALMMAHTLKKICDELKIQLVYKASFDKANRTSIESFRGPGLEKGLEILRAVKDETGLPVLS